MPDTLGDSILKLTKKALSIDPDYDVFDPEIVMHINGVFMTLNQLGVGPTEGFAINDDVETWTQYLGANPLLNAVKTYMYLRVRLIFDPPSTSYLIEAFNAQVKELEWRLNVQVDTPSDQDLLEQLNE